MYKAMTFLLLCVGVALGTDSRTIVVSERPVTARSLDASCRGPSYAGTEGFLLTTKWLASHASATELRAEIAIAPWPPDSVHLVTDSTMCTKLDSLIVAWLAGPGAGTVTGVSNTVGVVTVARIGPTTFHVRPGQSLPPQSLPQYHNFIVDTAPPARVAHWAQS